MLLTAGFLSRFYVHSREETIVGKVARLLLDEEARAVRQVAVHACESLGPGEIFVPTAAVIGVEESTYVIRLSLPERKLISRRRRRRHTGIPGRRALVCKPVRTASQHGDGLLGAGELIGSYVKAADGWAGHVEDLLIDVGSWSVSHFVVATVNLWPGKRVLAPREWLAEVDSVRRVIHVTGTRGEVRDCAAFDPDMGVSLRGAAVT